MGLGLLMWDTLRGHPKWRHGTQPTKFVGLWVRDGAATSPNVAQAFYVMPDRILADLDGLRQRLWHCENSRLFIDTYSLCGNAYPGTTTSEYSTKFVGPDQLLIENRENKVRDPFAGRYRRWEITDQLRSYLLLLQDSKDDAASIKAYRILKTINRFDRFSKLK